MNDLGATLSALKRNLETATKFMDPWGQFHDDVAMASLATPLGVPEPNPRLERCIAAVAGHLFKQHGVVEDACFLRVPEHHFWHGSCRVAGRVVICFYFDDAEVGLAGFMRSVHSSEVTLTRLRPIDLPAGARSGGVAGNERRN